MSSWPVCNKTQFLHEDISIPIITPIIANNKLYLQIEQTVRNTQDTTLSCLYEGSNVVLPETPLQLYNTWALQQLLFEQQKRNDYMSSIQNQLDLEKEHIKYMCSCKCAAEPKKVRFCVTAPPSTSVSKEYCNKATNTYESDCEMMDIDSNYCHCNQPTALEVIKRRKMNDSMI